MHQNHFKDTYCMFEIVKVKPKCKIKRSNIRPGSQKSNIFYTEQFSLFNFCSERSNFYTEKSSHMYSHHIFSFHASAFLKKIKYYA